MCRAPLAPLLKRDPGPLLPYLSIVSGITDLYMPSRIVENFFFLKYIYKKTKERGKKKKREEKDIHTQRQIVQPDYRCCFRGIGIEGETTKRRQDGGQRYCRALLLYMSL